VARGLRLLINARILAINPDNAILRTSIVGAYEKSGRISDARALYKKIVEGFGANDSLSFLASQGDKASLTKLLAESARTNNASDLSIKISNVYFKLDQYNESAIWSSKSLKEDSTLHQLGFSTITDPSHHIEHAGLNAILNSPKLAPWMAIRRKNFALFN
jgi:hypothetical protein